MRLAPARTPTMYFIGVTTGKSMIMRVFPKWARHLGLGRCRIRGIDLPQHADPARYRDVVSFIKSDPLSLGALVTTHKIDLLRASRDLFDGLDDFASLMGEASSISKENGRLLAGAKDPITSGLALDDFLPAGHWGTTGAHAFIIGAGGSSIALVSHIAGREHRSRPTGTARRFQPQPEAPRGDAGDQRSAGHSTCRSSTCSPPGPRTTTRSCAPSRGDRSW